MLLFLRQAWVSVAKFQDKPCVTNIAIDDPEQYMKRMTISICMSKRIYANGGDFQGNKDSFWKTYTKISDMILDVSVTQNLMHISVWNSTTQGDDFEINFYPSDDGDSIDFCHTLKNHYSFQQMQITVIADIFFYIHREGQLI